MFHYPVLGGILRSELPFPELAPAAPAAPTWTLRAGAGEPPSVPLVPLGERRVGSERLRLWETPAGRRLEYSHAGTFDLLPSGEVTWYGCADSAPELVRAIVLGPVLALALEAEGCLCLHGSAVAVDDRAIAFLGPKHAGKSTLATALTAAGARLISDDVVALVPGAGGTTVRAGVACVRLWDDSALRLRVDALCPTVIRGIKTTASGFERAVRPDGVTRLDAVYLLSPSAPEGEPAVRTPLAGPAALVALAHQTKLPDTLVGLRAAGRQLRSAARVVASTPVYALQVARDFEALPAAVEQVLDWHSAPALALGMG